MSTFISDLAYNPGFPPMWEGLGYESAEAAIPHWYGVSVGDGNNGVSHMYPSYYVRTCEPFELATAAILGELKPEYHRAAIEVMEVDGEKEFGISATIYNPEDIEPAEAVEREWQCNSCGHEWRDHTPISCPECEECEIETHDESTWSEFNGAWMIVEVFPVDQVTVDEARRMIYDSLDEALSADVVEMARAY